MPQEQPSTAPVVLVVENDVLLRLVTASSLRDAGFEVIEAADSAEAIRILDCIPVDVLFSDIDMPGKLDGLALAQLVRRRRLDTRIILTSGAAGGRGGGADQAPFFPHPPSPKSVVNLFVVTR